MLLNIKSDKLYQKSQSAHPQQEMRIMFSEYIYLAGCSSHFIFLISKEEDMIAS